MSGHIYKPRGSTMKAETAKKGKKGKKGKTLAFFALFAFFAALRIHPQNTR